MVAEEDFDSQAWKQFLKKESILPEMPDGE
jgi:hypothetical protein